MIAWGQWGGRNKQIEHFLKPMELYNTETQRVKPNENNGFCELQVIMRQY